MIKRWSGVTLSFSCRHPFDRQVACLAQCDNSVERCPGCTIAPASNCLIGNADDLCGFYQAADSLDSDRNTGSQLDCLLFT